MVAIGFVGVNTLLAPPAPPPPPAVAGTGPGVVPETGAGAGAPATPGSASPAGPAPEASPTAGAELVDGAAPAERRSYAIGLQDLAGFPPDAAPGVLLELWVTWEPPVTREPRLQKLVGDVVLDRIIPGSVPEAPVTVLLSVPADRVGDLIYADGYGRLSVALPE